MTITSLDNTALPVQNKPLMAHRNEQDLMNRNEHSLINTVKMFVQLRQDLERVRNLSYMCLKREKCKRQVNVLNHEIFLKQVDYLNRYGNSAAANSASNTNVLQQKSINSIASSSISSQATTSSSPSTTNSINSRLREILQTKLKGCIYDFPEFWSNKKHKYGLNESSSSEKSVAVKRSITSVVSTSRSSTSSKRPIESNAKKTKFSSARLRSGKVSVSSEFVNKIKNKYKSISSSRRKH